MKRLSFCALILVLLSAPAFAAKNAQTVNFPDAVKIGTAQLPAGDYKVTWDGTGSNVQITLQQKGVQHPVSATVAAQVEEQKNNTNGYIMKSKDGVNAVESLQFTRYNVVFEGAPAQGQ